MEDRLEPLVAARPWVMSPGQVVADLDLLVPWLVQAEAALLARVRELDGQGVARRAAGWPVVPGLITARWPRGDAATANGTANVEAAPKTR